MEHPSHPAKQRLLGLCAEVDLQRARLRVDAVVQVLVAAEEALGLARQVVGRIQGGRGELRRALGLVQEVPQVWQLEVGFSMMCQGEGG